MFKTIKFPDLYWINYMLPQQQKAGFYLNMLGEEDFKIKK